MKKILVVRLSSLGDIALTAPVYRNIRAHWPDARISVMVKPQYAAALAGHPCIDEIIPYEGFFSALARARAGGFTHYLDLHANPRSALLGVMSGIAEKSRYRKDSLARRFFVKFRLQSPALERHVLDRYLDSLIKWGIPVVCDSPSLADLAAGRSAAAPSKICIIQTAFLGDAVLTVPLVRRAAQLFPQARLAVAARPETADIFRRLPEVAQVIVDDKRGAGVVRGFTALVENLRSGGFSLALIPHRSFRSALAAKMAGIPERVGFDKSAGRAFLTKTAPFSWLLHDAERNLSLLNAVAGAGDCVCAALGGDKPLSAGILASLEAETGWKSPLLIGVHPGSVWPTKRWPPERFAQAIRLINAASGAKAVLVGGKGDAGLCSQIAAACPGMAVSMAGRTDMRGLIALVSLCGIFLTNDSGPMHIASACGVPVVALFGPTTKELGFFPYGKGHRVLQAGLPCRPCALHGGLRCPRGHFLCMRLITADAAARAGLELLSVKR
ncbi:MAG: glycosyltransferase family 9 protein [Elusimicrobiales bacterium]